MPERYLGIDVGAETVKVAELTLGDADLCWTTRHRIEHHRQPGPHLLRLLQDLDWENVSGGLASVSWTPKLAR